MREVGNERCSKKNDTGGRKSSYPRIIDAAVNGVASHFGNNRIIATPSPAQKVVVWTKTKYAGVVRALKSKVLQN